MGIEESLSNIKTNNKKEETKALFQKLIQQNAYVGELFSINYETARIIIHDSQRKKVGGIPSLGFLIATRIDPTELVLIIIEFGKKIKDTVNFVITYVVKNYIIISKNFHNY
jgi:hypothetical protein